MDSHKVAVAEEIPTALSNPQNEDPGDSAKQLDIIKSGNTIAEPTIEKDEDFGANVDIKITEATVGIEIIEAIEATTKVTEVTKINEVTEEIEVAKLTQDTEITKLTENAKASAATQDTKAATEVTEFTEVSNVAINTTISPTLIEISNIADKTDSSAAQVANTVNIEEIGDDILDNVAVLSNNEIKNIGTEIINTANEDEAEAEAEAAFTETNVKSAIEISTESANEINLESNSISTSSEFKMHAFVDGVESIAVNETTETRIETESNFAASVSSLTPKEIQEDVKNVKTLSTEVELDNNDDSASQSGTDHASGIDCIDLSDSESSKENYRNARRTPPQQSGDDVSSTDGDNCEAIGDDGNEEQEQVHVEEHHVEPVQPKESPQPPRKVDDDEDKNNPQYIPKRGTFYEHDYRTTEDVADAEKGENEKEKVDGDGKKKVWHDKQEKWSHDKFKNDDQTPKSRDELIAIYGYDIRNEDGPPRARRRRRYGRGPNKYTRNWEDEDAYYKNSSKKPTQQVKGTDQSHEQQEQQKQQETSTRVIRDNPRAGSKFFKDVPQERDHIYSQDARGGQPKVQSAGTGRVMQTTRDYIKADYKSFTKARNYNRSDQRVPQQHQQRFRNEGGNSGGGDGLRQNRQHTSPGRRYQKHTNDNRDANVKEMNKSMGSLSLQQQQFDGDANQQQPPERKVVPKRYSAMRQRPFPDANILTLSEAFVAQQKLNAEIEHREHERMVVQQQQQQQQQHFYEQQQQSPTGQVNVAMCAPPQLGLPPRQCLTDTALAQQLAAAGRQIHPQQQPQRFVGGVPPLQPTPSQFISPPPQFITRPPQPPPINLNYQLAPQHFYQHQQAPPPPQFVSQPMGAMQPQQVSTEQLFQPQGGITYYSPEDQQTTQRHAPRIRPKAAIPIVPPPPTLTPMSNNSNSDS